MSVDDALHRLFLEQLAALERHRIAYAGQNPDLPLAHGDQDIQRLLEAQAFFSARTRRTAERSLSHGLLRLFGQHFPYLLSPVPSLAMVEARTDPRFVDPVDLVDGEPLALDPPRSVEPNEDSPSLLHFRLLRRLTLRPLRLEAVVWDQKFGRGGGELMLVFDATYPRGWPVGRLRLFVDHLGELGSSLSVFHALFQTLLGAEVFFGRGASARSFRRRCPVAFGPLRTSAREGAVIDHPLQQARFFFRLPEQDLFLTFDIPEASTEWDSFTICLHLSEHWPRGLRLTPDTFRLHVAPMVNLRRDFADPVEVDGAQTSYPLTHPDATADYRPHSVQGVYRMDSAEGLVPMMPGFVPETPRLAGAKRTIWEVELEGPMDARRGRLRVDAPSAIETGLRVAVDAYWHQPARASRLAERSPAQLLDRHLEGVAFRALGRPLPPTEGGLEDDLEGLLALLAARGRRALGLAELVVVLAALRGRIESPFDRILRGLAGVDVQAVPSALISGGFRYDYILSFQGLRVTDLPLLHLLAVRLREVLEAWSTEEVVGLTIRLPELESTLDFRGGEIWR